MSYISNGLMSNGSYQFINCNVIELQVVVDTKEVATRFIACIMSMFPMMVAISVAGGSSQFDFL